MIAHTCNPSYSGSRDQRITVQGQTGQEVQETPSQINKSWVQWGTPATSAPTMKET
jgi:hypothetical protein